MKWIYKSYNVFVIESISWKKWMKIIGIIFSQRVGIDCEQSHDTWKLLSRALY